MSLQILLCFCVRSRCCYVEWICWGGRRMHPNRQKLTSWKKVIITPCEKHGFVINFAKSQDKQENIINTLRKKP